MKKHALNLAGMFCLVLSMALLIPQRAAANDEDDPPSRVARLAYTHGSVSFNPAGTDDWVSAVVNRPITTGDKLWNDSGARSELNIGSAVIRLGSSTGFSFLNLTDSITQLRITEGTLNIRVRNLDTDETFEVDTPNLAFSILRAGNYKIDVNEAGDTTVVVVRDGEGEVTGGGSAYTIHPREIGTFIGNDQLDADVQSWRRDDDDFDSWCEDRDRRVDRSVSAKYVSSDAIGYEDLDDYGGWRPEPEYGTVWFPHTTVVGWAPYHYGHWIWVSPWGWTWVDDEPWGFAPFHYGRWVVIRGAWGWVPCAPRHIVGVAYIRPVYAPALVAWIGGPHFAIGIGIGGGGNVGWFPLGPREVYMPSYRVSRTYVNNVNISNTTVNNTVVNNYYNTTVVNKNVTNIKYVNQGVPGAVTATTSQTFISAQPVGRNSLKIDHREMANAQVAVNSPTIAPDRRAVLGAGAASTARPPAALQNRAVVAKIAPPPRAVAFEKQQEAIKANGGRPLGMSEARQLQPQTVQERANIKIAPPAQQGTPLNMQGNRPGNMQNNPRDNQNNAGNRPRPGTPTINPEQSPANPGGRPAAPTTNTGQPPANSGNQPGASRNPPSNPRDQRQRNDRPPSSRPTGPDSGNVDPRLAQKQQQQQEQLRQKQDQERQKVEQQQQRDREKLQQKNANDQRQQQANQRQQQQLEQLERKHDQEQQKQQQKQQQQQQKQQERPKEKPSNKPPKEKDDKPPHRN